MSLFNEKIAAKAGIIRLFELAGDVRGVTEENKAEVANALADTLSYIAKRARGKAIVQEELAKLDTRVDLGLPELPALDLMKETAMIRQLGDNTATSVENIGKIIAAAAPIVATALLAL